MNTKKGTSNGSRRIMLTIPTALLRRVDEFAARTYDSRSGVIRLALLGHLAKSENAGAVMMSDEINKDGNGAG